MLTEETTVDRIEVLEDGVVLVRRATFVLRDGERMPTPQYHRTSYAPGTDVAHEDPRVQAITAAAWTPDVIEAHQARSVVALHQLVAQQKETPNGEK